MMHVCECEGCRGRLDPDFHGPLQEAAKSNGWDGADVMRDTGGRDSFVIEMWRRDGPNTWVRETRVGGRRMRQVVRAARGGNIEDLAKVISETSLNDSWQHFRRPAPGVPEYQVTRG